MFNTRNIAIQYDQVPSQWIFQYYITLPEQLSGQNVKIKSVFNPTEKTPSMFIYYDGSHYKFKDFSTGLQGDGVYLVHKLHSLTLAQAFKLVIKDYNNYIMKNGKFVVENKPVAKWTIDYAEVRPFNQKDADYWLQFRIGKSALDKYNIKALSYYNAVKSQDEQIDQFKVTDTSMYGYYTESDELYKVYRPLNKKSKFFSIVSYIQGIDQLDYNKPYLVICASLKDALSLRSFGYNIEVIAPSSENSLIKPYVIDNLKSKYKKIITLFDNDDAGSRAIERYKELYDINGCSLDISKDISDAVRDHSFEEVHAKLKPLLKKTIYG